MKLKWDEFYSNSYGVISDKGYSAVVLEAKNGWHYTIYNDGDPVAHDEDMHETKELCMTACEKTLATM